MLESGTCVSVQRDGAAPDGGTQDGGTQDGASDAQPDGPNHCPSRDGGTCRPCQTHADCADQEDTPACLNGMCVLCTDDNTRACPSDMPACQNNQCVPCTEGDPGVCAGSDTPACHDGGCVTCTESNPLACGGDTCSAFDQTCREGIEAQSRGACEACASDTECADHYACVLTPAAPAFTLGFCLPIKSATGVADCKELRGFASEEPVTTVSGASVTVCRPTATTCEAWTDDPNACEYNPDVGPVSCEEVRTVYGLPDRACTSDCVTTPDKYCLTTCFVACRTEADCLSDQTCDTPPNAVLTNPAPAKVCRG